MGLRFSGWNKQLFCFGEGVFEVGLGDVFSSGGLDAFDTRIVIYFQNISFPFRGDEDINAADSKADAMQCLHRQRLGFFVRDN